MFTLLERWAALEPAWCRLTDDGISFGPTNDEDWIGWDWDSIPWREEGSIQHAVMQAISSRNWVWKYSGSGTLKVGQPDALYSIIIAGKNFTQDLLNAYVQRLEMEVSLLTLD